LSAFLCPTRRFSKHVGGSTTEPRSLGHLSQLDKALDLYLNAGAPPLPSSPHFRLRFSGQGCQELGRANGEQRLERERALEHFLSYGEPPCTPLLGTAPYLASGLSQIRILTNSNAALSRGPRRFSSLSVVPHRHHGENTDSPVEVSFFDWLTETPVREVRPGFKVEAWAEFQS